MTGMCKNASGYCKRLQQTVAFIKMTRRSSSVTIYDVAQQAGESGCGKSTLALSLMGYYFPPLHYTSGEIIIDGRNISGMDPDEVRKLILGAEIA